MALAKDELPTTAYAVLGVVAVKPMSGYEVAQFVAQSIANFWPIAKSQVYGELSRLESLGLIEGRSVRQERRPDKINYRINRQGEKVLSSWVKDSAYPPDRFRSGFLLKLFFSGEMPKDHLLAMVEGYGDQNRSHRDGLAQIVQALENQPALDAMRMTAELGVKVSQACAEWAEETAKSIRRSRSKEGPGKKR